MTQPGNTHVSGSETFLTYDPPIAGTSVIPPGVLVDADGNILDGRTRVATQTPTISNASVYATGDAVGGLLTFASIVESSASAGTLDSVVVVDKGQQLATLELVLFDQTFTSSSDNAVFNPSDGDLANSLGVVKLGSDWANFSTNSVLSRHNIGLAIKLAGTSLYGQLVVRGTPTYTSTSDLIVKVAVRAN